MHQNYLKHQFIPTINSSEKDILNTPADISHNYYLGGGVKSDGSPINYKAMENILLKKYNISMIHLFIPDNVKDYYEINQPYSKFIKALGRVGITFHYNVLNDLSRNVLFRKILRIHISLPEAVIYIENCHDDLFDIIQMVKTLREMDIETYMLLDTCHLEMDACNCATGVNFKWDYVQLCRYFKNYIGAFHLSASQKNDGYLSQTHGKPILNEKDENFFYELCMDITSVNYPHDVFLIAEVTEETYDKSCIRPNGKKCLSIIEKCLPDENMLRVSNN